MSRAVSHHLAPSRHISPHLAISTFSRITSSPPDLGTSHVTPGVEKLLTHLADVSRRLATSRPSRHISHHLATSRHIWGDVDVGWLQLWLAENRDKKFIRAARIVLQHLLSRRSRPRHAASRAAPVTGAWVQRRKPYADRADGPGGDAAKPPPLPTTLASQTLPSEMVRLTALRCCKLTLHCNLAHGVIKTQPADKHALTQHLDLYYTQSRALRNQVRPCR